MTVMTKEQIEALLAGLGSSDETWTYDPEDSKVREGSGHEICWDSTDADGAMIAAAPALARTAIALHQQLADAQATQALVAALREAAKAANEHWLAKLDAEAERDALAAKLADAEARVRALTEALRPFASVVKQMSQNHFKIEDDDLLKISGKDLLQAHDTLAALTTPAEETKG